MDTPKKPRHFMPKICRAEGCSGLTDRPGNYCPTHEAQGLGLTKQQKMCKWEDCREDSVRSEHYCAAHLGPRGSGKPAD